MEEGRFFERPILNSPYEYPGRHRELGAVGPACGLHTPGSRGFDIARSPGGSPGELDDGDDGRM